MPDVTVSRATRRDLDQVNINQLGSGLGQIGLELVHLGHFELGQVGFDLVRLGQVK